ncbi:hypothetical protein BGZ83_011677 [Gryganskiella cystojenkinii]|nr:hypothetical protein BGZ83_011677 [Gryganskiella cystojenkinii]
MAAVGDSDEVKRGRGVTTEAAAAAKSSDAVDVVEDVVDLPRNGNDRDFCPKALVNDSDSDFDQDCDIDKVEEHLFRNDVAALGRAVFVSGI